MRNPINLPQVKLVAPKGVRIKPATPGGVVMGIGHGEHCPWCGPNATPHTRRAFAQGYIKGMIKAHIAKNKKGVLGL